MKRRNQNEQARQYDFCDGVGCRGSGLCSWCIGGQAMSARSFIGLDPAYGHRKADSWFGIVALPASPDAHKPLAFDTFKPKLRQAESGNIQIFKWLEGFIYGFHKIGRGVISIRGATVIVPSVIGKARSRMSEVSGIIEVVCHLSECKLETMADRTMKAAFTGNASASKEQIIKTVQNQWWAGCPNAPDIADAYMHAWVGRNRPGKE